MNETVEYHKHMETAWQQVQTAQTPAMQAEFIRTSSGCMLTKITTTVPPGLPESRLRTQPVGKWDPTYSSRPWACQTAAPLREQPSGRSLPQLLELNLPNLVTGYDILAKVLEMYDLQGDNVANPPPKTTVERCSCSDMAAHVR
jgi:hypothetical protein